MRKNKANNKRTGNFAPWAAVNLIPPSCQIAIYRGISCLNFWFFKQVANGLLLITWRIKVSEFISVIIIFIIGLQVGVFKYTVDPYCRLLGVC